MTNILLVGAGGFIGSVLRYLVSGWVQQSTNRMDFPFGILVVLSLIHIYHQPDQYDLFGEAFYGAQG